MMMEHAELVVLQKSYEKVSAFLKLDGRVLNGEQKEQLKLPDIAEDQFVHNIIFIELPPTDVPFSPVSISQELHCHTFVSHQLLLGYGLTYFHQYQLVCTCCLECILPNRHCCVLWCRSISGCFRQYSIKKRSHTFMEVAYSGR